MVMCTGLVEKDFITFVLLTASTKLGWSAEPTEKLPCPLETVCLL